MPKSINALKIAREVPVLRLVVEDSVTLQRGVGIQPRLLRNRFDAFRRIAFSGCFDKRSTDQDLGLRRLHECDGKQCNEG